MTLEQLGWGPFFERQLAGAAAGLFPARVVETHKGRCHLAAARGELDARVAGRLRHEADGPSDLPAVGDWVLAEGGGAGAGPATVRRVLERRSKLSRRDAGDDGREQVIATNLDRVFLVTSLNQEFNARRLERYLALIWESGAQPAVLLNKADLCPDPAPFEARARQAAPDVPVHVLSAREGRGFEALAPYFGPGRTAGLIGSSGVGKSAIINRLAGAELQRTGAVRKDDDRGRHTTTSRRLIPLPAGGLILDTPGLRSVGMWESPGGLGLAFGDLETLAPSCRYRDCGHLAEPGCAVREAVEQGTLSRERYEGYLKLQRELGHQLREQDAQERLKEKKRIKSLTKAYNRRPNRRS